MNDLEFQEYKKGYNLHYLETNKFKTNLIEIYFMLPLENSKEAAMNALLPLILKRGSKNYKNNQLIRTELENLYGSNLSFNILKRGENQLLKFSLEMVNENYLNKKSNLSKEAFSLLNDILFNPLTEKNSFKRKYFEQEKKTLKQEILALINDKYSYTVEKCIKKMCQNEKYGIYKLGSVSQLEAINNQELYQYYKKVFNNAKRSLFMVGNFKEEFIESILDNQKLISTAVAVDSSTEVFYKDKKTDFYQEELDVNQAKLSIGFRTGITRKMDDYYALLVFNSLIGSSTHSLLFQEIREKRSLAYYVSSSIETTKALLLINSGINADNYKEVVELVKEGISKVVAGDFEKEKFERSKKSVINKLKQDLDSNKALSAHYLLSIINDKKESINKIITEIESLTPRDIMRVAKKLKLDTIYLLKSGE